MRHLRDRRKLGRTSSHRRAMLRNLVTSLFVHERVETTVAKAKEARREAEHLITFAKRGDLHARRQVGRYISDKAVVKKLFDTIAPWYAERNGGYTRVLKTKTRLGDAGEMAFLELVKTEEQKRAERKQRREQAAAKEAKKAERRKELAESAPKEEKEEKKD
jgi:large subunit ribosomal protein L17